MSEINLCPIKHVSCCIDNYNEKNYIISDHKPYSISKPDPIITFNIGCSSDTTKCNYSYLEADYDMKADFINTKIINKYNYIFIQEYSPDIKILNNINIKSITTITGQIKQINKNSYYYYYSKPINNNENNYLLTIFKIPNTEQLVNIKMLEDNRLQIIELESILLLNCKFNVIDATPENNILYIEFLTKIKEYIINKLVEYKKQEKNVTIIIGGDFNTHKMDILKDILLPRTGKIRLLPISNSITHMKKLSNDSITIITSNNSVDVEINYNNYINSLIIGVINDKLRLVSPDQKYKKIVELEKVRQYMYDNIKNQEFVAKLGSTKDLQVFNRWLVEKLRSSIREDLQKREDLKKAKLASDERALQELLEQELENESDHITLTGSLVSDQSSESDSQEQTDPPTQTEPHVQIEPPVQTPPESDQLKKVDNPDQLNGIGFKPLIEYQINNVNTLSSINEILLSYLDSNSLRNIYKILNAEGIKYKEILYNKTKLCGLYFIFKYYKLTDEISSTLNQTNYYTENQFIKILQEGLPLNNSDKIMKLDTVPNLIKELNDCYGSDPLEVNQFFKTTIHEKYIVKDTELILDEIKIVYKTWSINMLISELNQFYLDKIKVFVNKMTKIPIDLSQNIPSSVKSVDESKTKYLKYKQKYMKLKNKLLLLKKIH